MIIESISIESLIPYARNARTHSDEQVAQIAASIREFGFTNPVLIDSDGGIIAGHGRVMGARKLAMDTVPCIRLSHLTDIQKRAYILADNKLALNAGWDEDMLMLELQSIKDENYDISLCGFYDDEFQELMKLSEINEEGDIEYSKNIEAPIYTPKGEIPDITELVDSQFNASLVKKIKQSNITNKEKAFLIKASSRHNVFDYHKIAEYYCHATPEMQELIEESALVIIDFDKAIENGYVQMTKQMISIYSDSYLKDDKANDDE